MQGNKLGLASRDPGFDKLHPKWIEGYIFALRWMTVLVPWAIRVSDELRDKMQGELEAEIKRAKAALDSRGLF